MSENIQDGMQEAAAVTPLASKKRWYVVHVYSGMEKSVQRALTERIERAGMQDQFSQILVPTEEVIEVKNGQKSVTERRFFPGYVLVEMEMTDETWHLVKNTNKVTGFIGGKSNKPTPIPVHEVDKIMQQMQEGVEKPRPKVLYDVGELVREHRRRVVARERQRLRAAGGEQRAQCERKMTRRHGQRRRWER